MTNYLAFSMKNDRAISLTDSLAVFTMTLRSL